MSIFDKNESTDGPPRPEEERESPLDLFDPLQEGQLPDALDALVWEGRPSNPEASPLARNLSRQLAMAQADKVRSVCAHADVHVARLKTTGNFWLSFPSDGVEPEERDLLLGVESAINRAYAPAIVAENNGDSVWDVTDAEADELSFLPYQLEFLDPKTYFDKALEANPYLTLFGVEGRQGGEWDVRTRLSGMLENIKLATRLEYSYDVNLEEGYLVIEFAVPGKNQFPSTRFDAEHRAVSIADTLPRQRALYAVKLALVLADMCFGTSVAVTDVDVIGRDGSLAGLPVLGYRAKRFSFNRQYVQAMTDEDTRADASEIATARDYIHFLDLTGLYLHQDENEELLPVDPLELKLREEVPLWQDTRELPEKLRGVLRADVASELDIYHDAHPELTEELELIRRENADSAVVSVMAVEEFLSRTEGLREPAEGAPEKDRQPLYCSNMTQRLMIDHAEPPADVRYEKIADAAFNARCLLSSLYLKLGDVDHALEADDELVRLAPTCERGYLEKLVLLGNLSRWQDVIDTARTAIPLLYASDDQALAFYRTAFAFWQTGDKEAAAACYVLSEFRGDIGRDAQEELNELLASMGHAKAPDKIQALSIVNKRGIGVPVTDDDLRLAAYLTVNLVDGGFRQLAWHVMMLLSRTMNDVYESVYSSLRDGVPEGA
jgi:hypothetical protein